MSSDKVQAIVDWPEPRRVKDVQSFLGFANFYRCFIHGYSDITVPLTCLTKKGMPWDWSDECHDTFNTLKKVFLSAPVLTHWIPGSPIVVETNASDYALTAIISMWVGDELHPIAFHSRTFNTAKRNYDVHDKELLAIFEAFKK